MKLFTVMIYEDGSNELEYEIDKRYKELLKETPKEDINIVMQTSKLNRSLAKLLRPNVDFSSVNSFPFCRRFEILKDKKGKVYDLGNINMADPTSLEDFILWSANEFPAERYILIVGGHGFEFVGMITDYSQDKPYIMGFLQLSTAIVKACIESNICIDILILDTCYANNIETFYELGKYKEEYIKYLITYTFWGNINGVSYESLTNILEENIDKDTHSIVVKLSERLMGENEHFPIISVKLDHIILDLFKSLYSKLALLYMANKKNFRKKITPFYLLTSSDVNEPWYGVTVFIRELAKLIIIYDGDCKDGGRKVLPMRILSKNITEVNKKYLYGRLSFTDENYWFNLLCNIEGSENDKREESLFMPIELPRDVLFLYISSCNQDLSIDDNRRIVATLIKEKKWNI